MIDISKFMTDEIIKSHRNYIANSTIEPKLKLLIMDKFLEDKLLEFEVKEALMPRGAIKQQLVGIINEIISIHIIPLRQGSNGISELKQTNIFIATPFELNCIKEHLERKYPLLFYYISKEEYSEENLSNKILDAFGYEIFSRRSLSELSYLRVLKRWKYKSKIKSYSDKNINLLHERKRKLVESLLEDIALSIKNECNTSKWCGMSFSSLSEEINAIIVEDFSLGDLVSEMVTIIKRHIEGIESDQKGKTVTLHNYEDYLDESNWSAYDYIMRLGIKSCPYCNRQYITPVYSEKNGKARADIDHFISKAKQPFFSMSLFNLIPSCGVCNSSLKNDVEFDINTHVHPYVNGFKHLKFSLEGYKGLMGESNVRIALKGYTPNSVNEIKREKENAKVFKLESMYSYHLDEAQLIYDKRKHFPDCKLEEFQRYSIKLTGKSLSRTQVVEFLLGKRVEEDQLAVMTLSKFYRDISNQVGFFEDDVLLKLSEEEEESLRNLHFAEL